MVQTLEAIKDGGGSIRVGATGTIGSLMSRELESPKSAPQTPRLRTVSGPNSTSAKRGQARNSSDQASTSSSSTNNSNSITKKPEATRKTKGYNTKGTHRIPMLTSDNIPLDRTPTRQKSEKKGHNIAEIVDIKCGHPDRAWSNPITSKLKKLGFSKLSETII